MRPEVIIFDLGGVFLELMPFENKKIIRECAAEPEESRNFLNNEDWFNYERGLISSEEFFKRFKQKLRYPHDYEQFKKEFCDGFSLNKEMFNFFIHELKVPYGGKTRFWLLSNINELHYNHLRKNWPGLCSNFLMEFLSFKMGHRKPDPEIYEAMLKQGGKQPQQCLFIDDTEINGEYPRKIGMPFIHFKGLLPLKIALLKFDFEIG